MPEYTANEAVLDKLWTIISNVEKQTPFWTKEQLVWLAQEIQPPSYWPKNRPTNEEAVNV